ncbi:hypothetical protein ACFXG4_35460 [Nocardia sp. NPDC059246]|uniref:Orn/Lys/Arg family decarboxylase n=1 Tax=unclassified Nocardia TaxID=2637762 RepID=UPI0036A5DDF9
MPPRRELSAYNSVAQLRNDIWWHIADTARRLAALGPDARTEVADLERYLAYDDDRCEYLPADQVRERLGAGQPVVSATFVTPYPPGFPVLVPGQEFSTDILDFTDALDTKEIHGLDPGRGYRVLNAAALAAVTAVTT